jgi:hypothetical protein
MLFVGFMRRNSARFAPSPGSGGGCRLYDNVFRKSFEALPTRLDHGDRDVSGLARVDVSYDSGFACMHATTDLALSAVFEFPFGFHLCCGFVFRLYWVFRIVPRKADALERWLTRTR